MTTPKFGSAEELEDDPLPERAFYAPGDLGKMALPVLREVVSHRAPEGDRGRLSRFLEFLPPADLEDFLVHVLQYGANKVFPPEKKTTRKSTAP